MGKPLPVVYFLCGDDEFAMARFIAAMEARLGDETTVALNKTLLDARNLSPEEVIDALRLAALATPFMSRRRLVVLNQALSRLERPEDRHRFLQVLQEVPQSTAVLIVETYATVDEWRKGEAHRRWLEDWAREHPERTFQQTFSTPKREGMIQAIRTFAEEAGGEIHPRAAALLAEYVGADTRRAYQEVLKLCAYAGYTRQIVAEDVETLVLDSSQESVFALVEAIGMGETRRAMTLLRRLLETEQPSGLLSMIVRQFRLLILVCEARLQGKPLAEVQKALQVEEFRVPGFAVEKLFRQAARFSLRKLEEAYRGLLALDEAAKSSELPLEVGLETFVASFTIPSDSPFTPIQK